MPDSQHSDSTTNGTIMKDAIPQNDKPPSCQVATNKVNEEVTNTAAEPETTSITNVSTKSSQTALPDYNQATQAQQTLPSPAAPCSTRPPGYTLNGDPNHPNAIQRQAASGTNPYDNVFSIENIFIQREQAVQQRPSASNNLNNAQGDDPRMLTCTVTIQQFMVGVIMVVFIIVLTYNAVNI